MKLFVSTDERVTDALAQWRGRAPFPTELGSADLRGFSRELLERSVFSARATNARFVGELAAVVDEMLAGTTNLATGRWRMMKLAAELGYDPEIGFPEDMADVPRAERDSLQDLSSKHRLDLMLETNVRMAANYGRMKAGTTPVALAVFPAWELVRTYTREIPRGTPESRSAGWDLRWQAAGEAVAWKGAAKDEWIAHKLSPIWSALGDGAGGYDDAIGNPYPPFAFQSGMGWRAVPAREWREVHGSKFKVLGSRKEAQFSPGQEEVRDVVAAMPADLRESLKRELEEILK